MKPIPRVLAALLGLLIAACGAFPNGESPAQPQHTPLSVPAGDLMPTSPPAPSETSPPLIQTASPEAPLLVPTSTPISVLDPPGVSTDVPPAAADLPSALNSYLEQIGFVGVVLVAEGGEVVFEQGYGMADYAAGVPNTPEARFRFASVSKAFTAAAVIIAQEEGLLDIDDTINVYADGFAYGDSVTIRQLLGHTSGIQPRPQEDDQGPQPADFEEVMDWIKAQPLMFEPGTQYAYSNDGYRILGYILEQVTGQGYGAYVQSRILDPLGMAHTVIDHNQLLPGRAVGHKQVGAEVVPAGDIVMDFVGAAGQMIGTAGDLYLWDRALAGYSLINASAQQEMFSQNFGWFVTTEFSQGTSGLVVQHHGGFLPGFRNHFVRIPAWDAAIVLLSNLAGTDDETISRSLADILAASQ